MRFTLDGQSEEAKVLAVNPLCSAVFKFMSESEIIRAEIPDLEKIVRDECWLEGERRGVPVDRRDETIRLRVAEIILDGVGAYLRSKYSSTVNGT